MNHLMWMTNLYKNKTIKCGVIVLWAIILLFSFGCTNPLRKKASDTIVFLGDSITSSYNLEQYFPNLPVINSGVWGDRTDEAQERLKADVYSYKPKKVFILLGINDVGYGRTNDDIAERIENIIKDIQKKCPYTEIFLISVYPLNVSDFEVWFSPMGENVNDVVDDLNEKLIILADDFSIEYIDMTKQLKNENNELKKEFTVEGLHLTEAAYEVISEALGEHLD